MQPKVYGTNLDSPNPIFCGDEGPVAQRLTVRSDYSKGPFFYPVSGHSVPGCCHLLSLGIQPLHAIERLH